MHFRRICHASQVFAVLSLSAAGLSVSQNAAHGAEHYLAVNSVLMHNVRAFYKERHCGSFGANLDVTGLPENSPAIAQYLMRSGWGVFMTGFENSLKKGAEPLPCDRWVHDAVQIAVKFNISNVQEELAEGGRVVDAFLSWEPVDSQMDHIADRLEKRPWRACRGEGFVAGNATDAWSPGYTETKFRPCTGGGCLFSVSAFAIAMLPFTNRTTTLNTREEARPANYPEGKEWPLRHEMNVTRIVNGWFLGTPRPNHGIVLSPPVPPALRQIVDESSLNTGKRRILHCWRMLKDIRLKIITQ